MLLSSSCCSWRDIQRLQSAMRKVSKFHQHPHFYKRHVQPENLRENIKKKAVKEEPGRSYSKLRTAQTTPYYRESARGFEQAIQYQQRARARYRLMQASDRVTVCAPDVLESKFLCCRTERVNWILGSSYIEDARLGTLWLLFSIQPVDSSTAQWLRVA